MSELESPEKIAKDIAKLERNLNQVADITFEGFMESSKHQFYY